MRRRASTADVHRRLPVGAEPVRGGGVHFRVWAPARSRVAVVVEGMLGDAGGAEEVGGRSFELEPDAAGYFSGFVEDASAGTLYRFRLDEARGTFPDPASRFQPGGPHGPSCVVDPSAYAWGDDDWRGCDARGQVLYELHVGTFTREGTWTAAERELPALSDLGITVLEVMPIADFAGEFGWGYDGVDLFAPTRLYGAPDDVRRFVDAAHLHGIGVILDVVYNHLGPDGNFLAQYSPYYFSKKYATDWGDAINFDGPGSGPVRELFLANAAYWIEEFHFDGLRIDATQNIYDASERHILGELVSAVREAARGRRTLVVAENEPQQARLVRPREQGGFGFDAVWNDDFHHSAVVALTGRREAYYRDHRGHAQEFVSAAKHGFLYQGQWYGWQKKRRGSPALDLPPTALVHFTQNHDQVANSAAGLRLHQLTSPSRGRAMSAVLLLGPQTPMLFMGQEFDASTPFLYFADQVPELAEKVRQGRRKFLAQFPSLASPQMDRQLPDPGVRDTFERCKLVQAERTRHRETVALHSDLLALRRGDPVFRDPRPGGVDGAVLADVAFLLRFTGVHGDCRLLVVNFGAQLELDPVPEPLLAPPAGARWRVLWTSEDPRYGGLGAASLLDDDGRWSLPAEAAVVLAPAPGEPDRPATSAEDQ